MKTLISRTSIFVMILVLVTSCFDQPELEQMDNFKIDELSSEKVRFNVDLELFNPNGYNLKVRKSTFDVHVNGQYIGIAKVLEKVKIKRKSTEFTNAAVQVDLEEGIFFKLLSIAKSANQVELKLDGVLKASASIIPVRRKICYEKTLSLKDFNFNKMLSQ
ncbi:MAG: LEA type 2 family protein [Bacteroidota bacterium]